MPPLLPKRFLFRFAAPCLYCDSPWTAKGAGLGETYRLISFAELEGRMAPADVRMAWSEAGLGFTLKIDGKTQPPWCRAGRPEESDGLHLFIDTRDVHNVHRASRFCHHVVFMPGGTGRDHREPVAEPVTIHRAREHPATIRIESLKVRVTTRKDGYTLHGFLPAEALTGFDVEEHPRLGFTYAVLDRELGEQTFGVGSPMPYQEDPSLWATLELTR